MSVVLVTFPSAPKVSPEAIKEVSTFFSLTVLDGDVTLSYLRKKNSKKKHKTQ